MNHWPNNPVVYEINAWVWLNEISREAGRPLTLAEVPQSTLEGLAGYGFDGLWLMGIWERSREARRVAQEDPGLQAAYRKALPDYQPVDIVGSPYAIYRYQVDPALGGAKALASLRERLRRLDLHLMLDFVPNHLAIDNPWIVDHPERLLRVGPKQAAHRPDVYFVREINGEMRIYGHGRDPNFAPWTDTVQVDYRRPEARRAMTDILLDIAAQCDGVRCDMAMLVNRHVFRRTWGGEFDPSLAEFWPAAVTDVKVRYPGFLMSAEAYWDLEWELQQMGFGYAYDKRLYDRLLHEHPDTVRQHLGGSAQFQQGLVRFIENHDEQRAVSAFGPRRVKAAATLVLTLPGMRLLHQGQLEGRQIQTPVQLGRWHPELPSIELNSFYRRLLAALQHPVFHDGEWRLTKPLAVEPEEFCYRNVVAHLWWLGDQYRLVVVNLAPEAARCRLVLDIVGLAGRRWHLKCLLTELRCSDDGDRLISRGIELKMPGYGFNLFEFEPA